MATTFMNLDLPTPTVTLGPEWATELNTALETIDAHDHTSDKGQKVPTAGLNINEDLDFQTKKAFELMSVQFDEQSTTLTGATNAASVYVSSGDLYYTNTSGVAVQLTTGGSIVTTPSSASTFEIQQLAANLTISPASTFVYLVVDTTASRTIDLPLASSVSAGRIYIIKDSSGQSFDNAITINTQGSDLVDGSATLSLQSEYGSWMIIGDGISNWYTS